MARIILADDGIRFDGRLAETAPLGGAETAVVGLAEALARRGHEVAVYNKCDGPLDWNGVAWRPIGDGAGLPASADLYVANRGDRLLPLVPRARARAFWIHNPAGYLLKWRYLWKLARWRPAIVFSGAFHASTYPRWAPDGGRAIVPLGVAETFRALPEPCGAEIEIAQPPPRAVFTSNPLRSLDWLLDLWVEAIRPRVPGAELHVFSGPQTYGGGSAVGEAKSAAMRAVLGKVERLAEDGVVLRGALAKSDLARELRQARLFLYRGDPGETFCLAAAEAQASGLPAVVGDVACLHERVVNGKTGFVTKDKSSFADSAVRLLTDDALWRTQHAAALARGAAGWDDVAQQFETFFSPFGELAKSTGPGT
jgi:glycosyltransferase involved in cell wall biosynthesis